MDNPLPPPVPLCEAADASARLAFVRDEWEPFVARLNAAIEYAQARNQDGWLASEALPSQVSRPGCFKRIEAQKM